MKNTLTKPTPVRFSSSTHRKLKELSVTFGIRPASLIRFAVDSQLQEFERQGQIVIPASSRK